MPMSARFDCSDAAGRALGIEEAVAALRRGELVVLPTDTVYGVAADAFQPAAVAGLLAAKGRGREAPPPVLVGTVRAAAALVEDFGTAGEDLIDQFWPGGLTLVCRARQSLLWDLGDTKGTVAVRMPLHPVALDLLKQTGPLAVSSANLSGEPSATTAAQAEAQLGAAVAVYLDGGACPRDVPSTIVDLTGTVPRLLRAGAVPIEQLREVIALAVSTETDEKVFSADERAAKIIQEAFGAQAPGLNAEPPGVDVAAPGVDVAAPGVDEPQPEAEPEPEPPAADAAPPAVDEAAPGVDEAVDEAAPGVDEAAPAEGVAAPGLDVGAPAMDIVDAAADWEALAAGGRGFAVDVTAPVVDEDEPG
jgi:L-threonylcarbamoyladenylate synthase